MNVDKIARLFSAQTEPAQNTQSTETVAAGASNSDETTVSSLNDQDAAQASGNDGDARAAKVAALKTAVSNGTYNPSSTQVASSVYQELFV